MMKLGARIESIKRVSRTLSESHVADIDLVLRQCGLSTTNHWDFDDLYSYCVWGLNGASDETLAELDDYLHSSTQASAMHQPWSASGFHIFITHVAGRREEAVTLKSELSHLGAEGFVAHQDIEPAKEWQRVIEAALLSCHALVALLHKGFRESSWCDQEVGYVLGRGVPVIPVAIDMQPYGFFGALQSLDGRAGIDRELMSKVGRLLLHDPRTGQSLTEAIVATLAHSRHWWQSNMLAVLLADDAPKVTEEQMGRLRDAQRSNVEVRDATRIPSAFDRIAKKFFISEHTAAPEYPDEEPF